MRWDNADSGSIRILADGSSALPKRLANLGFDVRLVISGYRALGGSKVLAGP